MNGDLIRYAVAAAVLWYVFAGPAAVTPGPAGPYTGTMSSLHTAAASMEAKDREVLSEALDAASKMISDDRAGLLTTTESLQKAARGAVAFGYSTFTATKYPAVASLIQADLEKAIGTDVVAVTPEVRSKVAGVLSEAARAIR